MKKIICMLLCFFPLSSLALDNSYKVVYDGGSLPNAKTGPDMKLSLDGNNILIKKGSNEVVTIPANDDHGDQLRAGCPPEGVCSHRACRAFARNRGITCA
jgi:hypothetical protein